MPERYEKLLDAVSVKDEKYEPGDDPRKLRPVEIDSNPESNVLARIPLIWMIGRLRCFLRQELSLQTSGAKKAKSNPREK